MALFSFAELVLLPLMLTFLDKTKKYGKDKALDRTFLATIRILGQFLGSLSWNSISLPMCNMSQEKPLVLVEAEIKVLPFTACES